MIRHALAALALAVASFPVTDAESATLSRPDPAGYRVIDLNRNTSQEVFRFGADENVWFIGPSVPRTKRLRIEGGNHVVVTGGNFAPHYAWTPGGVNATGTIQTVRTNGSIYIENVHIDNKGAFGSDALTLNSAGTRKIPATILNSTAVNVSGAQQNELAPDDRAHGDIVQPQGALSDLTIVNFNGSTDYQGLFLMKQDDVGWGGKVDSVHLENVNLWHTGPNANCAYLLGIGGTSRQTVTLRNVTLTRQPRTRPCAGESVMNYGNAAVTGSVSYVDSGGPVDYGGSDTPAPDGTPGTPVSRPDPGQPPARPQSVNDPVAPPPPGVVAPPDPATVAVPQGQPPIPAVPPAQVTATPPTVHPPPLDYVPPVPPAPPPAASVLTDLSNHPLFAAAPALNLDVLNGIVETFRNQAKLWETTLSGLAMSLFAKLALIELVWVIGWATARRTGLDDMLAILAEQIVIIGFFYWLMINTADFVLAIIDSFAEAANQASVAGGGSRNLGPSDVFAAGINMTRTVWDGMTITNIPFSMLLCLAGIINIIVFAKITAKLIEVLIESSFTAYAGIVLMGFGGTRFTRDYATAVFRYAISVGVKRLFLQLIIGLGQGIIVGWATKVGAEGALNWQTIGIMIGAPLIMYGLAETLPQKAQDLIMGVYTGGSGASVGKPMAVAAAAVAGGIAGSAGGIAAGKAAFQLAKTQLDQRRQGGQSGTAASRMGRAAQLTGLAARNLGSAAASDVGKRLSGTGGRHGHRSWRMASDMTNQASQNRASSKGGGP